MKRIITNCLLVLLLFSFNVRYTFAHILKTQADVGVVFHLEPDHDPVVGEPAFLSFEIKDKKNILTPSNCDCSVSIVLDENVIYQKDLFTDPGNDTLTNQSFSFIFPSVGIYKVVVEGKSNAGAIFSPFNLEFNQRVSRESVEVSDQQQVDPLKGVSFFPVLLIIIILLIFVISLVVSRRRK